MVDALLMINKYRGITSFDVIERLRKILGIRRVGHCGTLDPLARGLVLVCLGRATKLVQFLTGSDKEYIANILLGISTETYDRYGAMTSTRKIDSISDHDIASTLEAFTGEIEQVVPLHSAVKYDGRPMYKYARRGESVPEIRRTVKISTIELIETDFPHITIRVVCSKGTYIRSLASDLGEKLGCGAHLFDLTRTRIGKFRLDDALTLGQIEARMSLGKLDERMVAPSDALDLPSLIVADSYAESVHNGSNIHASLIEEIRGDFASGDEVSIVDTSGKLLAVGKSLLGSEDIRHATGDLSSIIEYIRVI